MEYDIKNWDIPLSTDFFPPIPSIPLSKLKFQFHYFVVVNNIFFNDWFLVLTFSSLFLEHFHTINYFLYLFPLIQKLVMQTIATYIQIVHLCLGIFFYESGIENVSCTGWVYLPYHRPIIISSWLPTFPLPYTKVEIHTQPCTS